MKILSLFDGMSVAQQALKNAGIPVEAYYASEIDEYAKAVTQSNFPNTIQLGSVTDIKGSDFTNIDLIVGGSPCTDLSIAKKGRQGLEGSQSKLFYEFVRLVKEIKPKFFILENVASMAKDQKAIMEKELFDIEATMINASLVSAQNRKRIFIVGKKVGDTYVKVEIPQPEDRGILLKDILESGVDEKYYLQTDNILTESKNPDIAGTLDTGTWLKRYEQIRRVYNTTAKSPTIPTGTGGGVMTKIVVPVALRNRGEGKKPEYNGTGKANAMTSVQTDSMVDINTQIRKLTPTECLRLQSMPDDYFDKALYKGKPISNTQRYKMCGNAFNCKVIEHILKYLI